MSLEALNIDDVRRRNNDRLPFWFNVGEYGLWGAGIVAGSLRTLLEFGIIIDPFFCGSMILATGSVMMLIRYRQQRTIQRSISEFCDDANIEQEIRIEAPRFKDIASQFIYGAFYGLFLGWAVLTFSSVILAFAGVTATVGLLSPPGLAICIGLAMIVGILSVASLCFERSHFEGVEGAIETAKRNESTEAMESTKSHSSEGLFRLGNSSKDFQHQDENRALREENAGLNLECSQLRYKPKEGSDEEVARNKMQEEIRSSSSARAH